MKPLSSEVHQFRTQILSLSGEDASKCIQCGKCTAGCPVSLEMDIQPNQVLRLIQINDPEPLLRCQTIWICASCQTCSVRCPEQIDIAKIMDSLRKLSLESQVSPGEERIVKFDNLFLNSIQKRGRVHELELVMRYNLTTLQLFKDIHLGLLMISRRKLSFMGDKIKGLNQIKRIFKECKRFLRSSE